MKDPTGNLDLVKVIYLTSLNPYLQLLKIVLKAISVFKKGAVRLPNSGTTENTRL